MAKKRKLETVPGVTVEENRREIVHLIQFLNARLADLNNIIKELREEVDDLKLRGEIGITGKIDLGYGEEDSDND